MHGAQVVLVSATLPHEVLEMTHKFMSEPLRVLVKRDELTLEARARHPCCRDPVRVALARRFRERADARQVLRAGARGLRRCPCCRVGFWVCASVRRAVGCDSYCGALLQLQTRKNLKSNRDRSGPSSFSTCGIDKPVLRPGPAHVCILCPVARGAPRTSRPRRGLRPPRRALTRAALRARQGIKQFFVAVEREEWKFDTLCDLYDTLTITQAVIFCNTKRKARRRRCDTLGYRL